MEEVEGRIASTIHTGISTITHIHAIKQALSRAIGAIQMAVMFITASSGKD